MAPSRPWRPWRDDEEMVKKDDDLSIPEHHKHSSHAYWQATHMPRRTWTRRAAVYVLIIIALVYLFNRSESPNPLPSSRSGRYYGHGYDYDAIDRAYAQRFATNDLKHFDKVNPKLSHSPPSKKDEDTDDQTSHGSPPSYDGPIRYPELPLSLRNVHWTGGSSSRNRNVLFATASLRSASILLPVACEMARARMSIVHFAFMGKADVTMKDLLELNGMDESCSITTHDARPDRFQTSTERRLARSAGTALYHIDKQMHPQAIFIDTSSAEEAWFLSSARSQVSSTQSALIELPDHSGSSLSWITKLDSAALSAWNKVRFDILIHANPTGMANLKRLLSSIQKANFAGVAIPHITIELPNVIEKSLEEYLAGFQWPPSSHGQSDRVQMLSLRHRITRQKLDEDDSSVRFVESFWPTDPSSSHVLVMSPTTQVTPQFFQYVKYSLLHQLHSRIAMLGQYDASVLGISLSVPTTSIDGTTSFTPPRPVQDESGKPGATAFRWQRPNSDAMLFRGEKWVELHHFIAQTLHKKSTSSSTPALLSKKEVSKKYPAWLEYALQLSRLRGYYTLYPSQDTASVIVGAHSDMPHIPEEYQHEESEHPKPDDFIDRGNEHFESKSPVDMLETLPNKGELQNPAEVPLLSWDDNAITVEHLEKRAREYTTLFRKEVGQCGEEYLHSHPLPKGTADDLFCK